MNNMPNSILFAQQMIRNNPDLAKNPQNKAMIDAIMNNDAQMGEQIANNLLNTVQTDKTTGLNQAVNFFQQMMGGNGR